MSSEEIKSTPLTPTTTVDGTVAGGTKFIKRPRRKAKRSCALCRWGFLHADYKDVEFLKKRFLKNNKIITHKITGNCLKHQKQISTAIKRARIVALLPFVED